MQELTFKTRAWDEPEAPPPRNVAPIFVGCFCKTMTRRKSVRLRKLSNKARRRARWFLHRIKKGHRFPLYVRTYISGNLIRVLAGPRVNEALPRPS